MTYELVHFAAAHNDDTFRFRGADLTGAELAVTIRGELIERLTGEAAPYNSIFTTNGIASTTATIIAAALGYTDIDQLDPASRSRRSSRPTCCWPCSTPGSPESSRCPAGTCAAC